MAIIPIYRIEPTIVRRTVVVLVLPFLIPPVCICIGVWEGAKAVAETVAGIPDAFAYCWNGGWGRRRGR